MNVRVNMYCVFSHNGSTCTAGEVLNVEDSLANQWVKEGKVVIIDTPKQIETPFIEKDISFKTIQPTIIETINKENDNGNG